MITIAAPLKSRITTWVFDLDNTLYPASVSLFPQIDVRIRDYVSKHLGLEPKTAYALQKLYYREHGTTLRGLMTVNKVDPHDFLAYVHDIDHSVLEPAPRLNAALQHLPGRKLIFTNGSRGHAAQVLKHLGIEGHFEAIFDIVDADFIPKPRLEPYQKLGQKFAIAFDRSAMIEDLERNLTPASQLGMTTVWLKQDDHPDEKILDQSPDNPKHIDHIAHDLALWLEQVVDSKH